MLQDVNKEKIRCFVIADDYRWHVLTDDLDQFLQSTLAYIQLMNESKKENHYYFKNIFLERGEYQQIKKNLAYNASSEKNEKATPIAAKQAGPKSRPSHLQLVVSNP